MPEKLQDLSQEHLNEILKDITQLIDNNEAGILKLIDQARQSQQESGE